MSFMRHTALAKNIDRCKHLSCCKMSYAIKQMTTEQIGEETATKIRKFVVNDTHFGVLN